MKKLKKQVIELLNIVSPSGNEQPVINYVKPELEKLCDKVWIDDYGNLLAEKVVGGVGYPTIILSAHMDSVNKYHPDRKVIENNGVIRCTKGILGADDKAGIAIILAVLRNIGKTSFKGKIKVVFSREEEIGCVGADRIDKQWISDAQLAIVVDRRGNRDIVVGCGKAYCSDAVADFFEDCSRLLGMDWKAVEGGVSDALVFSEAGINSVNLSAGYYNEHTDREYLVLKDMKSTVVLVLKALSDVGIFVDTFGQVPATNSRLEYSRLYYLEKDGVFYYDYDVNGDVYIAETYRGHVLLTKGEWDQREKEIVIPEDVFESMVQAYLDTKKITSMMEG